MVMKRIANIDDVLEYVEQDTENTRILLFTPAGGSSILAQAIRKIGANVALSMCNNKPDNAPIVHGYKLLMVMESTFIYCADKKAEESE